MKLEYKGYVAKIKISEEDEILYGEVDSTHFQGNTVKELLSNFHKIVEKKQQYSKINQYPQFN